MFLTIFLLLASGCAPKATVYTVTRPNLYGVEKVFVVDTINEAIDDGTDTYHYTLSPYNNGYSVTIEYPNGATYSWQQNSSGSGSGGWSHDYNPYRYVDGGTLCDVLEEGAPRAQVSEQKNIPVILLILAVGLFNICAPSAPRMLPGILVTDGTIKTPSPPKPHWRSGASAALSPSSSHWQC